MKLSEMRREYESDIIGPLLLQEIRAVCSARARKYPPSIYGLSSEWDEEAVDDLVQDVVVKRLIGERQIDYLFDVARTASDWRALLDRQVRITLARRRVRTVVDNLIDRAKRALRKDDQVITSKFSRWTVYSLRGAHNAYQPLDDQQVRRVAERVRVIPKKAPGLAKRAPSVYAKREFEVLLYVVLHEAPGGITVRDLGRILEYVFTDWIPAVLELSEEIPQPVTGGPDESSHIRELADSIIADLSKEDATIISGRLAGLPDVEIARLLDISRPTLIKRSKTLFDRIRSMAEELDESGQDTLMDHISTAVLERSIGKWNNLIG